MTFLQKLRAWWNKDAVELAEEETRMTQHQRDIAQEDYEARKDDAAIPGEFAAGAGTGVDFERDSEKPRP